jgi:mannosyltransferase OCH1-like enzyme
MTSFLKPGIAPDPVPSVQPYIPRILWQTSKDRSKISPELMGCVNALKAMNPGWEHRLFDDESQLAALREVCSDRFMRAYARIQPRYGAARADLFRYVMVYLHGGAYLDLKSGTERPLDEILRPDDHFIISQWDNGPGGMFPGIGMRNTLDVPGGEYEQWFVIASPGHPFLAETLEQAILNIENFNPFVLGYGGAGVLSVTGPNVYTKAIRRLESKAPARHICAWPEGLRYTMLQDLTTHQKLDKSHYDKVNLAPVTAVGLTGLEWVKFHGLDLLHLPVREFQRALRAFRQANYARLARRRARKIVR